MCVGCAPAPSSGGTIDSTVLESVRHERLAWGTRDGGVYAPAKEMQNGWLATVGAGLPMRVDEGTGESGRGSTPLSANILLTVLLFWF
jgi:hypothetical protein